MIISYSNLGLDVSSAILSDHPDLWFLSANPFDAILTMSAKTSESALQSSLDRAAKYVIDALGCTVGNFNKISYIKCWVHFRLIARAAKYVIHTLHPRTVGYFSKRSHIKYWVYLRLFGCWHGQTCNLCPGLHS